MDKIASAILLLAGKTTVQLAHRSRRVSTYAKLAAQARAVVRKSQKNKSPAAGQKALLGMGISRGEGSRALVGMLPRPRGARPITAKVVRSC